jgi:hypothetical protein
VWFGWVDGIRGVEVKLGFACGRVGWGFNCKCMLFYLDFTKMKEKRVDRISSTGKEYQRRVF